MSVLRLAAALALALLLAGCASVFNRATNAPMTPDTPLDMGEPKDIMGEYTVALSFSGGGLRASAISLGVLRALQESRVPGGDLLDEVAFISSVSGGSLTAAYYALYGRQGLDRYREEVLLRDFERDMRLSVYNPGNFLRLLDGGLNARENFGDALDRHVFHDATFADLYRRGKPDIRIHATDLYHRITFPFIPRIFSILCSDIRSYSVADAVAASMAVPLVFSPVVVRTYPGHCSAPIPPALERVRQDPDAPRLLRAMEQGVSAYRQSPTPRYLKLVDGGVADNLGLTSIAMSRLVAGTPYAPMTERDAVRVRRMLVIVVDASRGSSGDYTLREEGPSGVDLALEATDAATDSAARLAADAFGNMLVEWEASLVRYRCSLTLDQVRDLGGDVARWNCSDIKLRAAFLTLDQLNPDNRRIVEATPTRLTLSPGQIDAAIEGARRATLQLPRLLDYLSDRR